MKDLVSIIIPIYNAENYLEQCIKSVLNQTYRNIEIILINDGSIDNSSKILRKYEKIDKRIKVYEQKNAGAAETRNRGITLANGEFITFIDSDDLIKENYINTLLSSFSNDIDIVLSGYIKKYGEKIKIHLPANNDWDIFKYSATWCKMYRLSYIKQNDIKYEKRLIMEDVQFNLKCYMSGAKYKIINYAGYVYNINAQSVTNSAKDKSEQLIDAIDLFKKIENERNIDDKENFLNFYILHFIFILNMCCRKAKFDFLVKSFDDFYLFLNNIDEKWYKIPVNKKENVKNKVAIYGFKSIYKYKLTKLFIRMFKKIDR